MHVHYPLPPSPHELRKQSSRNWCGARRSPTNGYAVWEWISSYSRSWKQRPRRHPQASINRIAHMHKLITTVHSCMLNYLWIQSITLTGPDGDSLVRWNRELKDWILTEMKKVDFFPRAIDFKACLPFDQAWSRTYKNEVPWNQSPPTLRKVLLKVLKRADFVWGFWSLWVWVKKRHL